MFKCVPCRLDVKVHDLKETTEALVTVWLYVGKLAPLSPHDESSSDSTWEELCPDESNAATHLNPKPRLKLSVTLSAKSKWAGFAKKLKSKLESLKKRESEIEIEPLEVDLATPLQLVERLPREENMKRQWESLEKEAQERPRCLS